MRSDGKLPGLDAGLPQFTLRSKQEYERLADLARERGEACTWADVRLADMKLHFPKAEDVVSTASVRSVHLWYLAYQQQLVADLDSEFEDVRRAAKAEIVRIAGHKRPLNHVPGGSS